MKTFLSTLFVAGLILVSGGFALVSAQTVAAGVDVSGQWVGTYAYQDQSRGAGTATAAFQQALVKWIDRSRANFYQNFMVFGNGLFDVPDLENVRGTVSAVDGGFHWRSPAALTRKRRWSARPRSRLSAQRSPAVRTIDIIYANQALALRTARA